MVLWLGISNIFIMAFNTDQVKGATALWRCTHVLRGLLPGEKAWAPACAWKEAEGEAQAERVGLPTSLWLGGETAHEAAENTTSRWVCWELGVLVFFKHTSKPGDIWTLKSNQEGRPSRCYLSCSVSWRSWRGERAWRTSQSLSVWEKPWGISRLFPSEATDRKEHIGAHNVEN